MSYSLLPGRLSAAILLLTAALATPLMDTQAADAPVRLIAFSPQVDPATAEGQFGLDYEIQFSTLENEYNGEFEFAPEEVPYDLSSTMVMEDPMLFDTFFLPCALDLPPYTDNNGNGVDDFFDHEIAIPPTQAEGAYISPVSGEAEPMTAVWSRAADTIQGTLTITIPDLGLTSVHTFRLLHFEGTYSYTPAAPEIAGQLALTNWWDSTEVLTGPLTLTIQDTATLTWQPGTLESQNPFFYTLNYFPVDNFDLVAGGQFLSFVDMTDGFIHTGGADYQEWIAFIEATDANGNEIPDLVESENEPPTAPSIALLREGNNIQLTITGTPGADYQLESAATLPASWTSLQPVSMEGETLILTLPISTADQYLRLKWEP